MVTFETTIYDTFYLETDLGVISGHSDMNYVYKIPSDVSGKTLYKNTKLILTIHPVTHWL